MVQIVITQRKKRSFSDTLEKNGDAFLYTSRRSDVCFLLTSNLRKKRNYLNTYSIFFIGFITLVFAEIFLRYTGISMINTISYFYLQLS